MLDVGEIGRSKDLSDFDTGQIVMARRLGQSISETARLVGCSRSAVMSTYRQWSEEGQTGDRVLGAQGSSMREGNEGYPVWSEPTEGLLWHNSQKILMVVMGGMCHNPQCITPCCIWG